MRHYGGTWQEAVQYVAAGARSLRSLGDEVRGVREREAHRGLMGRRHDLDTGVYEEAVRIVRGQEGMMRVRDLMLELGVPLHGGRREQFLRNLFPFDGGLFTSDDDKWIGVLGRDDAQGLEM